MLLPGAVVNGMDPSNTGNDLSDAVLGFLIGD